VRILGLDIGGANLKAATSDGVARCIPFALWRAPSELPDRLRAILGALPHDEISATMTGELCDCFASKRAGVAAILQSLVAAASDTPACVWGTDGRFHDPAAAAAEPWRVASANWHALATFAGRLVPEGGALLLDVGSTTTDIIPLEGGRPTPRGLTDPARLASGELVYTGVRRTPLCALLGMEAAAECFATTLDVYLMLGDVAENPDNCDAADGRPATRAGAHARLARMLCSDAESFTAQDALALARRAAYRQVEAIAARVSDVLARLQTPPGGVIVAGSGEFLARRVLQRLALPTTRVISLSAQLGTEISTAACAYAVAHLAAQSRGAGGPPA
jgi:probable H4MPT-linked C1 transfer pathway protein